MWCGAQGRLGRPVIGHRHRRRLRLRADRPRPGARLQVERDLQLRSGRVRNGRRLRPVGSPLRRRAATAWRCCSGSSSPWPAGWPPNGSSSGRSSRPPGHAAGGDGRGGAARHRRRAVDRAFTAAVRRAGPRPARPGLGVRLRRVRPAPPRSRRAGCTGRGRGPLLRPHRPRSRHARLEPEPVGDRADGHQRRTAVPVHLGRRRQSSAASAGSSPPRWPAASAPGS